MSDWHVVVIDGNRSTTHAFVTGFAAGRGIDAAELRFVEHEIEPTKVGDRLRSLLHGGHSVIVAPASLVDAVADALAVHGPGLGLSVPHRAAVDTVSFGWSVTTPSRDAATRIRAAFAQMPPDVTLVEVDEEEVDPSAKGVELRAQVHDYTFRSSGRVTGSPAGVLAMHRRVKDLDFVHAEPLHLVERAL